MSTLIKLSPFTTSQNYGLVKILFLINNQLTLVHLEGVGLLRSNCGKPNNQIIQVHRRFCHVHKETG